MQSSETTIFGERPEPGVATGPSWSLLAWGALAVSLLSPLGMLGLGFWWIPGFSLLMAALALLRLEKADPRPRGTAVAKFAMVISLAAVIAAPTHYFLRNHLVRRQARAVAVEWLSLITRNRMHDAAEGMRDVEDRYRAGGDLTEVYQSDEDRQAILKKLQLNPAVVRLRAMDKPVVKPLRTLRHLYPKDQTETITKIYRVTGTADGKEESFQLEISIQRRDDGMSVHGNWRIGYIRLSNS